MALPELEPAERQRIEEFNACLDGLTLHAAKHRDDCDTPPWRPCTGPQVIAAIRGLTETEAKMLLEMAVFRLGWARHYGRVL